MPNANAESLWTFEWTFRKVEQSRAYESYCGKPMFLGNWFSLLNSPTDRRSILKIETHVDPIGTLTECVSLSLKKRYMNSGSDQLIVLIFFQSIQIKLNQKAIVHECIQLNRRWGKRIQCSEWARLENRVCSGSNQNKWFWLLLCTSIQKKFSEVSSFETNLKTISH